MSCSVFKGTKWRSLSHLYILAPLSIAQVAASWKLNGVPLLSVSPCMFALDQNIWVSGITLETKLWLYNTCILPIFLYGSEIWCLTYTLEKKIDTLDNWCLRRILHIHWTDFVSNDVVRSRTGQPSDTIRQRRLSFFGHLCRADTSQDHSRALRSCIRGLPKGWRQRTERPRQIWLRTIEDDLRPLNFGLATARRRAMDRPAWRLLVDAATSS